MDSFFGFLVILKESFQILAKNIKLMILLTTLFLFLSSIFFLFFNFSSFSLMRDMLVKESLIPITSFTTAEFVNKLAGIRENFPLLLSVYISFVLSYFIITFLSTITTVIVTSESYTNSQILSLKELTLRIVKSWRSPLVTGFYTTILVIGYVFFVVSMATPLLTSSNISTLGAAVLFAIFAYIFYLYLSSVWILGIVVSVIDCEENCGIQALGKSAEIIKGQRINGFFLNIFLNLVLLAVFLGLKLIKGDHNNWLANDSSVLSGLIVVSCCCLVKIFTFVAYTVLYYKGKEKHGEEIELHLRSGEYAKLSNTTILVNSIP